jgi:hypothetical protein
MTTSPDDHNPGDLPDLESLANQFPRDSQRGGRRQRRRGGVGGTFRST